MQKGNPMIDHDLLKKEARIIDNLSKAQWRLIQHLNATEHPNNPGTKDHPAVTLYAYDLREILKLISKCKRELL
jgi:hypothetical protein